MKKTISIVLVLALGLAAEVASADFTFGTPTEVPNINSSSHDMLPCISADGLSLFFSSNRPGGVGGLDIWVATRETTDDLWGEPVNLGLPVCSSAWDEGSISHNGLSFYFSSTRNRGSNADIWVTTRDSIDSEWGTPTNLGPTVNSSADQCYTSISSDELELYFSSNRSGGYGAYDLWVTKRETVNDPWSTPENLGPTVNSSAQEADPAISADGLVLFFASNWPSGGNSPDVIWMTRRATIKDPWGEPVNLGPFVNSSAWEDYPSVSADGSTLFLVPSQTNRWNGGDIWQASIIPIVDLNGDEFVDIDDLLILIENWGTNETLCDIGPMPWGDGIVDAQDLEVLMSYWGQQVQDGSLAAHWKFDETEGIIAHDSTGGHDATVIGVSAWQPEGGIVNGTLEFDGATFVVADFVLSPSDGPFSVLAWVKGGAPGQAILSQQSGVNWLMLDPATGALMTELKSAGRSALPLYSETVITGDDWHRIGLTWDGSNRRLYVDDVLAVEDTQDGLAGFSGRILIGCGGRMIPGTFFTGLIDDIRIYNRVVTPSGLAAGFANMITDGEPYPPRRVLQHVRLCPVGL